MKVITPSTISERLKISGSLARAALKELTKSGLIRSVSYHSKQAIYSKNVTVAKEAPKKDE